MHHSQLSHSFSPDFQNRQSLHRTTSTASTVGTLSTKSRIVSSSTEDRAASISASMNLSASIKRITITVHPRAAVGTVVRQNKFIVAVINGFIFARRADIPINRINSCNFGIPSRYFAFVHGYPYPMHHRRNVGGRCFPDWATFFVAILVTAPAVLFTVFFAVYVFSHCPASLSAALPCAFAHCAHHPRSKTAFSSARA